MSRRDYIKGYKTLKDAEIGKCDQVHIELGRRKRCKNQFRVENMLDKFTSRI